MNREQAAKLLPIIKAYSEGAEIQHQSPRDGIGWSDQENPAFMDDAENYRIKPRKVTIAYLLNHPVHKDQITLLDRSLTYGDSWKFLEVELPV